MVLWTLVKNIYIQTETRVFVANDYKERLLLETVFY